MRACRYVFLWARSGSSPLASTPTFGGDRGRRQRQQRYQHPHSRASQDYDLAGVSTTTGAWSYFGMSFVFRFARCRVMQGCH